MNLKILLDTSAYVNVMRGRSEICRAVQQAETIALTPVVLGELLVGVERAGGLEEAEGLKEFLASSRVRLLDITHETAKRYAIIHNALRRQGTPIPANDLWIAASAMEHGLELVTCDAHFNQVGQVIVRFYRT